MPRIAFIEPERFQQWMADRDLTAATASRLFGRPEKIILRWGETGISQPTAHWVGFLMGFKGTIAELAHHLDVDLNPPATLPETPAHAAKYVHELRALQIGESFEVPRQVRVATFRTRACTVGSSYSPKRRFRVLKRGDWFRCYRRA